MSSRSPPCKTAGQRASAGNGSKGGWHVGGWPLGPLPPPLPHSFCLPPCTPSTETCAWKEKEAAKGPLRFTAAGADRTWPCATYCISLGPEEGRGWGTGWQGGWRRGCVPGQGLEGGASDPITVVSGDPSEENTRPRAAQRPSCHMQNRKKI